MPKVSPAHLESRRRGILAAAQRCVARNGVAATRMSDICRAANLSPGGVYRYFSGKEEILAALAEQRQRQVERFFRTISDRRHDYSQLLQAVRDLASTLDTPAARDGLHLDVHLRSEALTSSPASTAWVEGHSRTIAKLADALPGASTVERADTARAIVALLQGLALQKALEPDLQLGPLMMRLTKLLAER